MKLAEAIEQVRDIGYSYFYDPDFEDDNQVIDMLRDQYISSGPNDLFWNRRRQALSIVLREASEEMLDNLVQEAFGRWPEKVGGSRAFLQRILDAMYPDPEFPPPPPKISLLGRILARLGLKKRGD